MKILIATPLYPPDIGGPATYSKLLLERLPKMGIETEVLSFGGVRGLPKIIRHFLFLVKLIMRGMSVDLIYAQDTVSVGFPSFIASRLMLKRFFVRVPGDYAWEQSTQRYEVKDSVDEFQNKKYGWRVEFLRKIQKLTVNGAETVIAPSQYFRQLVSKWAKNPQKVFCIYNGIDLTIIPKSNDTYEPKTIISAGRLVSWKGFDGLIGIMPFLPDWKLVIAGDGPLRKNLERVADNLKVSSRVVFSGELSREKLLEIVRKSEVFVLNTSFESFSFQVVEVMASGVPVVTTNIGNLTEIIENNKSGILVEPDDKKAIISHILHLSDDADFRKLIVSNAQLKVQQFSIENTINNLLNHLKPQ